MRERIPMVLKLVCLVLMAVLAAGAYGIIGESRRMEDLEAGIGAAVIEADPGPAKGPPAASAASTGQEAGKPAPLPGPAPAEIPGRYRIIGRSRVLGAPPVPPEPRPALVGIAGDRAFIQIPGGGVEMLPEGGEAGGIKVLQIAVNRVLVEHKGKRIELTLFSGMGSESLLPAGKDRRN